MLELSEADRTAILLRYFENKPLREVSDAVVMISAEPEDLLHPEAERHFGVGVMTAEHQDESVNEDETVDQRGQRKPATRRHQQRHGDEDRKDFEDPRRPIGRSDTRPDEQP